MIPEKVIKDWVKKETHIQNRINRINKRLKKFEKQKKHFEMRLRLLREYKKKHGNDNPNSNTQTDKSGTEDH